MTEQEIFEGIARRDNRTFAYLYETYQERITRMVLKNSGNENDAVDIFQEGMIALWTNIQQGKFELQSNTRVSTYLYAVCRNLWISRLRKSNPEQSLENVRELEAAVDTSELESNYDRIKTLEQHFTKLKEDCRRLLRMFYYEKTSLRIIAENLGIGEKSAKNKKYRCMQSLRDIYENANNGS